MKLKYNFELVDMDDEMVAVPVEDGANTLKGIVKLNPAAADIFKRLQEDTTEEAVLEQLVREYDSPADEIAAYLHSFLAQLTDEGILTD